MQLRHSGPAKAEICHPQALHVHHCFLLESSREHWTCANDPLHMLPAAQPCGTTKASPLVPWDSYHAKGDHLLGNPLCTTKSDPEPSSSSEHEGENLFSFGLLPRQHPTRGLGPCCRWPPQPPALRRGWQQLSFPEGFHSSISFRSFLPCLIWIYLILFWRYAVLLIAVLTCL